MEADQPTIEVDSLADFDSITLPENFGPLELSPATLINYDIDMSDPPASASTAPLFSPEQQAWLEQWMASRLPPTATSNSASLAGTPATSAPPSSGKSDEY